MYHFIKKGKNSPLSMEPHIYLTGDKHRDFQSVIRFCRKKRTTQADTLIILGDACCNYYEDDRDEKLKKKLSRLPITLFCIYGNKETRPQYLPNCLTKKYLGGAVYYQEAYPNLLYAQDCELYQLGNKKAIVLGGAHSVDKFWRLEEGLPYWPNEEPDNQTKVKFRKVLKSLDHQINYVLTHTVPLQYEPTEMFLCNQKKGKRKCHHAKEYVPDIDKKTERWLQKVESTITYEHWFAGHYHTDKDVDKLSILYKDIRELCETHDQ